MKRVFITLAAIFVAAALSAQVTVTFNIDMNGVSGFDAGTHKVYFSGAAIGTLDSDWPEPGTVAEYEMSDGDGDGIYSISAENVADGDYEFKYVFIESGTTGWDNESIGYPNNHSVSVSGSDVMVYNEWGTLANTVSVSDEFVVFPNPSSGVFKFSENANYRVVNITGKEILNGYGNSLNLTNFDSGVYFIKLETRTNSYIQKIIKK